MPPFRRHRLNLPDDSRPLRRPAAALEILRPVPAGKQPLLVYLPGCFLEPLLTQSPLVLADVLVCSNYKICNTLLYELAS